MKRHLYKVKNLIFIFIGFDNQQVLRSQNSRANLLSKLVTSALGDLFKESFFEIVK